MVVSHLCPEGVGDAPSPLTRPIRCAGHATVLLRVGEVGPPPRGGDCLPRVRDALLPKRGIARLRGLNRRPAPKAGLSAAPFPWRCEAGC